MKKAKQLLWFVIPTAAIFAGLTVWYLWPVETGSGFMGMKQYLRLFMRDDSFWCAVRNTVLMAAIPALVIGGVLLAVERLLRWREHSMPVPLYYGLTMAGSSLGAFAALWSAGNVLYGYPSDSYEAFTVVMPAITPSAMLASIRLPDVLIALQIGVLISFLCWLIRLFLDRKRT